MNIGRSFFLTFLLWSFWISSSALAHREDRLFVELPNSHFELASPHNNWFRSDADFWRGAAQGMLEPLFIWEEDTQQLKGWLARRYKFGPNAESVTIWIQPEARWSDGRTFTAHDVAFSIDIARTETELDGPHVAAIRDSVESVRSPSRFRLEIKLKEANENFLKQHFTPLEGLSFPIVPRADWKDVVDLIGFENPNPIGTGPYTRDGIDTQTGGMAWSRNRAWWGRRASLRSLPAPARLFFVPESETSERRVRGITNGRLDTALAISDGAFDGMTTVVTYADSWSQANGIGTRHLPYSRLFWDGWPESAPEYWPESQQVQVLIHDLLPSKLNSEK